MNILLIAFISMGAVAFALAIVLYYVSRSFHVEEDLRIKEVHAVLPGVNCGACGFAGCFGLASALIAGAEKGDIAGLYCPPGGKTTMDKVGGLLNMAAQSSVRRVAVLRCGGSCEASPAKAIYEGSGSCVAANALFAGEGGCSFGCMGHGDCVRACTFEAMRLNPTTGLPEIDTDACTACGACVKACPRSLIFLRSEGPENKRVWVNCRNTEKGALARKNCSNACIACGKCVKVCADIAQAITMDNNLAVIDPEKCIACGKCEESCPTGAIVSSFGTRVAVAKTSLQEAL